MEAIELVESIYDHVEAGEPDKAVVACLRLARKLGDTFNVVMFLRELYPDRHQLRLAFFEETRHLSKERQEYIWKITQDRWIEERTIPSSGSVEHEDDKVLAMGAGELRREIEQMEGSIADLCLPPGMGEFDTAAFTDRYSSLKVQMRAKIRACNAVLERIRTRCLYYASRMESQIAAEARTSDLVGSIQTEVHNYFAERCEAAYNSLRKAASLIGSRDAEDSALLLTSIRRAVKGVADFFYPPVSDPVVCLDGRVRNLGEEQYLNRLQEFCARQFPTSTSADLLRSELDLLSVFIRRLNDVASKGVHANPSPMEARQGLLGVYLFLSNLIAKLDRPTV